MQYKSKLICQIVKENKLFNRKRVTLVFLEGISLKQKISIKDLVFILGISKVSFYYLKTNYQKTTFLNLDKDFNNTKDKVNLIKIELEHLPEYGKRFYSKAQLKYICSKNNITVDELLKNLHSNPKHYIYNKLILKNNKNGFWIGQVSLSNDFVIENYDVLNKKCIQIAYRMCKYYRAIERLDEFTSVAWEKLIEKGGIIEKNFQFDKNIPLGIFCIKIKYAIVEYQRKLYKDSSREQIINTNVNAAELNSIGDDRYNPALVLENKLSEKIDITSNIDGFNKKIIDAIKENIDMFFVENADRFEALNLIAKTLGITKKQLEQNLDEIKKIILENQAMY